MRRTFTVLPRQLLALMALIIVLPSLFLSGQTQKISIEEIKFPNGDPIGKINDIDQDQRGFIWLANRDYGSIIRYDGSHMKSYYHDTEDPNSLGGAYPECLLADGAGIIWIGLYGQGLDRFDPVINTFTHYRYDQKDPNSISSDFVTTLLEDHKGNLWVGTDDGLNMLDPNTGIFTRFHHDPDEDGSLSHNYVVSLYEDSTGTLWVGTGEPYASDEAGGLNRFDRDSGTFTRYLHDPADPKSLFNNIVTALLEDSYGNFWVGTKRNGLQTMDRELGTFKRYGTDPENYQKLSFPEASSRYSFLSFLKEDAEGYIWIGTSDDGIYRYDPRSGEILNLRNPPTAKVVILEDRDRDKTIFERANSGWTAFASEEGLVWIATEDSGTLFKIDLFHTEIRPEGNFSVSGFCEEPSNVLWVATDKGLMRKDLAAGTSQIYQNQPGDSTSLSGDAINSILRSRDGKIWVATNNGINEFDPSNAIFQRYKLSPEGTSSYLTQVIEDSQGNIWLGGGSGLYLLDRDMGTFELYETVIPDSTSFYMKPISMIREDSEGNIWVGNFTTTTGLNRIDPDKRALKKYLEELEVLSIHMDAEKKLWVSTLAGLLTYNPAEDRFEDTGLASTKTVLIDDSDNILWMYNAQGISRYDQATGNIQNFGDKNGVRGTIDKFNINIPFKSNNGSLFFGSKYGYYSFHPDSLWISKDTAQVYITDFLIDGNSIGLSSEVTTDDKVNSRGQLSLQHDQNNFSIYYSVIDYRGSGERQLFYTLENYDRGWNPGSAGLPTNYIGIPPGEYTFRIRGRNNSSGIWSEKTLGIVILPPWWQTWWAYTAYGLLLVFGVFLVHRYQRNRTIQKERERTKDRELAQAKEIEKAYSELKATQQQLIHSEKMASLGELTAGIAHEIKNPLNFVNNFSEVSRELLEEMKEELKKGDTKEAEGIASDVIQNLEKIVHHGQRADSIVRGMLQHSRSGNGQKEPTDINALADEYLRLAYHGLRARDKSFNANMETDFDPAVGEVDLVPQDMGRVLLNLLTNAFHAVSDRNGSAPEGYEPTVWVRTRKTDRGVEITVRDNGGGIPDEIKDKIFQPFFTTKPTGEGTGLGLSMAYDIVTKGHGGELTFVGADPAGTEFRIFIPGNRT